MKNLLLLCVGALVLLTHQSATAQCNAAFEWEQLPNSLSIHFINHSTSEHDIISNEWIFGDGHTGDGQNPTHTYDEPGVYLVCLIIHDNEGCAADVCHEVTVESVSDNCEAFFEFEINQSTGTVHFFDGSESEHDIESWSWNFGDGGTSDDENPIHIYDENGTYEVCLTIESETGCEDTYCHVVHIEGLGDNCEAFFEFEINQSTGVVHFFDGSDSEHDISNWIWDFGDDHSGDGQNPIHTYEENGTYNVCLTIVSETGCEDTYCQTIHIEGLGDDCEAFFEFEINQENHTVHFFDGSQSDHDIAQWFWNFGDGSTSNEENPIHIYDTSGTYEVCLVIVSETGCEDQYCHVVHIGEEGDDCEALFTFEINQEGNTVHFFNQSSSDHDIVSFIWHFGDGQIGDGQNPIHTYAEDGTYEVCLTIVSETGCEDTYCHVVIIGEGGDGCEAFFEFEINHDTYTVHFFDGSQSDHDIAQWFWNFGDGSTSNDENPVHIYDTTGTYEVCLVIVSETGCEDQYCHVVHIGEGDDCEALFSFEINQETNTVHFFNQSSSDYDIVSFIWHFGDGQTGDGQNPIHTYAHDGTYEVCLTIVSETGCEDTYCHVVHIGEEGDNCEAFFEFEINQETYTVHFFDGSESDHDIAQWFWNFGDGFTSNDENPIHIYDLPGTYEVCLVIVSETGCEDQYCHHVVIGEGNEPCDAEFFWEFNNETDSLEFHNISEGATDHTTWLWTFGDGSTSTEENPQHEYEEFGVYTICLIMTDTTTDCSSDVCHVFNYENSNEENNEPLEEEEAPANFTGDPIFRFTNPVSNELQLTYWISKKGNVQLQLIDLTGNVVLDEKIGILDKGTTTSIIAVPNVQIGWYTIALTVPGGRIIKPVLIIR